MPVRLCRLDTPTRIRSRKLDAPTERYFIDANILFEEHVRKALRLCCLVENHHISIYLFQDWFLELKEN